MIVIYVLLSVLIGYIFYKLLTWLNRDDEIYYQECIEREFVRFGYSDKFYNFVLWLEEIHHAN